jgi:hypothetical protein
MVELDCGICLGNGCEQSVLGLPVRSAC